MEALVDVDDVDDNDNDHDDEDGRDAVGVSHAAPPRLRPPDNGSLGGATYTPLYPPVYCTEMYTCIYAAHKLPGRGRGGDFRHAHDRIILSNTIVIISPKANIIIQLNILL